MRGLLYLIVLLAAAGCSAAGSYDADLTHAEQEMATDPDGALERLTAMDVSQLGDSALIARWALLYSEALQRNSLAAPGDTIINIAIDYYRSHGDEAALAKAKDVKASADWSVAPDDLMRARYLQKVREYSLFRERQQRRLLTAWGLAILGVALAAIAWLTGRLRARRARINALLAEAASLRGAASDSGALRVAVDSLFSSRFELIDRLCSTYYASQGTKAERNAIVNEVKEEIEAMRRDQKSFARLEAIVNESRDNVLVKLRDALPAITPADYTLAVYLACGFSPRAMALLLEDKIENVYKRKSRLKAKLAPFPDVQAAIVG